MIANGTRVDKIWLKDKRFKKWTKSRRYFPYKIPWIVLELCNINVTAVDGASDERLLFPPFSIADLHNLGVN